MVEDEYIAELFERAAGDTPAASEALARVRPRIRRAHRRRAVMRGSAGLAVLVVLGGLISQTTDQPSQHVQVGDTATTEAIESTTTSIAPSTTLPAEPQSPAADVTAVASGESGFSGGSGSGSTAPAAPTSASAPSSAPAAASPAKPTAAKPATTAPANTPASGSGGSPAAASPQVTSFDGQGGSVEVQYTDTSMNLQAVSPSPGWSVADTKSDGASIEVTFQSNDGSATGIEVHLDDAGRPTVDTPAAPVDDVANGLTGS